MRIMVVVASTMIRSTRERGNVDGEEDNSTLVTGRDVTSYDIGNVPIQLYQVEEEEVEMML